MKFNAALVLSVVLRLQTAKAKDPEDIDCNKSDELETLKVIVEFRTPKNPSTMQTSTVEFLNKPKKRRSFWFTEAPNKYFSPPSEIGFLIQGDTYVKVIGKNKQLKNAFELELKSATLTVGTDSTPVVYKNHVYSESVYTAKDNGKVLSNYKVEAYKTQPGQQSQKIFTAYRVQDVAKYTPDNYNIYCHWGFAK